MVELAPVGNNLYKRGFAGDTLNTAWYLRACLPEQWNVCYVTRLGDDALSQEMLTFMSGNGIDTSKIRTVENRSCGLYMISLHNGERTFSYWRENSPARELASDPDFIKTVCDGADGLFLSGITLAILPEKDRAMLIEQLTDYHTRGGQIYFDPNFRPILWEDFDRCRVNVEKVSAISTIVLPTHDDEVRLFGDANPEGTCERYLGYGAKEVVVKDSSNPVTLGDQSGVTSYPLNSVTQPKDTTGAGDSFNGAYLAARVTGLLGPDAIHQATRLSSRVINSEGALIEMSRCAMLLPSDSMGE